MLHDVFPDQQQNITILSKFDTHRPIMHGALYGMLLNCSFSAEKMMVITDKACVNEMK